VGALDQLVVATARTSIRDDLHASLATLNWTVNAHSPSFAVLLITGAALGDCYGRRGLFVTGLATWSAGREAVAGFFAQRVFACDPVRMVTTRANGCPAAAT
jgi:MFS family permease